MAFGLGLLRWPPDIFWAATPRELAAAAAALGGGIAAPGRAALARLMAAHPDRPRDPRDIRPEAPHGR